MEEVTPKTFGDTSVGMLRDIVHEHALAAAIHAQRWDLIDEDLDIQMKFRKLFGYPDEFKKERLYYLERGDIIRREWIFQWLQKFKNLVWCMNLMGSKPEFTNEEARAFVSRLPGEWTWLPEESCWYSRYDPQYPKRKAYWVTLRMHGIPVMAMTVQHYLGDTNYHMYISRTLESFKLMMDVKFPPLLLPFHSRVLVEFPMVRTLKINPVEKVRDILTSNPNLDITGFAPLEIHVNEYLRNAWKDELDTTMFCINCQVNNASWMVEGNVNERYCNACKLKFDTF
jgi:hypothetical protein